jgi:dienelactone hydrolase
MLLAYAAVRVTCAFARATLDVQVLFGAGGHVAGYQALPLPGERAPDALYALPSYVRLAAFEEQEVAIGSGPAMAPGTLSRPVGDGPFPAVVLIPGPGATDRDGTAGALRPFRDLAWGLASAQIAALRYDPRADDPSADGPVDTGLHALAVLRQTGKIDRAALFVLGHDAGAAVAAQIAARDPGLAGQILLAGWPPAFAAALGEQAGRPAAPGERPAADQATQAVLEQTMSVPGGAPPPTASGLPPAYRSDLGAGGAPEPGPPEQGLTADDYAALTHLPAAVIDDIARWVREQPRRS